MICSNCFLSPCSCESGGILPAGVTGAPATTVRAVQQAVEGRTARHQQAVTFTGSHDRDVVDESPWVRRARWHFDQIPSILVAIREDMNPIRATQYDANRVQTSKGDAPAPANLDALDDADDLWAGVVLYTREVAERLHAQPPASLDVVWMHHGEVAGLPTGLTPRAVNTAGFAISEWLGVWAPDIEWLVSRDASDALFRAIRGAAARWTPDGAPRRPVPRVCGLCGEKRVGVHYVDQDGTDVPVIECAGCGATEKEGVVGDGYEA